MSENNEVIETKPEFVPVPKEPTKKAEPTVKVESHEEFLRRGRFWRSLGKKIRNGSRIR